MNSEYDFCYRLILKVFVNHKNAYDIFIDCKNDLRADWYGIQKAKERGCCFDKVKDVYDVLKLEKPKKYNYGNNN